MARQPNALTPVARRLVEAGGEVLSAPTDRPSFLHAVLCQVGLPRRKVEGDTFERRSGNASLRVKAGELWDGRTQEWVPQPLPYGTRPRLALVHVSSEAVRTRNPVVEVGHSTREFLGRLGIDAGGREHAAFLRQMRALAACEMRLGIGPATLRVQPIDDFAAWLHPTGNQRTLWPGTITLAPRFFETLQDAAVPLDPRAIGALSHSALQLDIYTWLAHRLHRVRTPQGERVSWAALREQFGAEYADPRNFKREMRRALAAVFSVYPDARVEEVPGGLVLKPSRPPVPRLQAPVASV